MRAAPTPRTDRTAPKERRRQILEAAARLFVARGFRGASIDELGAAVGVSGPALYRHFRSKESLLAALLVGVSEDLVAGARELARIEPAEGALDGLIAFHVRFALDHPDLIILQSRDLDCLAAAERDQVRSLQREYAAIWMHSLMRVVPEVDGRQALAGVHATFGLINSTPHSARLDREAMCKLLTEMAHAALFSLTASGSPGERT
jgi:AcrR family transcriptional regulator